MTWTKPGTSTIVAPIQLSDGTCVVLVGGSLYWTTDRATLNLIGSLGANTALHGATLARDASDNLYVVGLISSTIGNGYAQAWPKGTGYSWASQPEQSFSAGAAWGTGGSGSTPAVIGRAYWTSTGGTVGAGQVMVAYQDTNGVVGVLALDAGALLSGSAPGLMAGTSYPSAGLGFLGCVQDGFGSASMWMTAEAAGSIYVYYVTVSGTGVTGSNYKAAIPGGATPGGAGMARYAPGAAMLVWGNVIAELSSTAVIYAPATFTVPSGVSLTLTDCSYAASVGRVWVYGEDAIYSLARFGITPGNPPTIDTSAVVEQANGSGWMNSQTPDAILTSDFAAGTIDYLEVAINGGSYTDYGASTLYAAAPLAATLVGPSTGAYIDASVTVNPSATYNSGDGARANAFALRIKTSGGSYQYLNTSTGLLQGTIVWNTCSVAPGALFTATLAAGLLANGNTYNWSIAFQESYGNMQGPFATDSVFTGQPAPTLILTGPSGTVTTAQPTVSWTATPGSGLSITDYQVIVETGSYGTTPGSGTQVWDSTVTAGNPGAAQVGVALANGTVARIFAQVTETHGETSVWQHEDITVRYDAPAAPTLTVYPDPTFSDDQGNPQLVVIVQGHDNYLTAVDASFEGGLGTWTALSGCTVDASTLQARDGSGSMEMVATGSGTMIAESGLYDCQPGFDYAVGAYFRAETVGRDCQVAVSWYDGTGTLISTVLAPAVLSTTTGWGWSTEAVASPSNAAQFRVRVEVTGVAGSGEKHLVDCVGVHPAPITDWSQGGFVGTTTATVLRFDPSTGSAGVATRYGQAVALGSAFQQAVVGDQECLMNTATGYTATVSAPGAIVSAASTEQTSALVGDYGWLIDPLDPSTYIPMRRLGEVAAVIVTNLQVPMSLTVNEPEEAAAFSAFGRQTAVVQRSGIINTPNLTLNLLLFGYAERETLRAMRASMHVLFAKTDMGDGWYVVLGVAAGGSGAGSFPIVALRAPDRRTDPMFVAAGAVQTTDKP